MANFDEKALFRQARKAMEGSWSPYSKFKVGAAILAENEQGEQKVFLGANVENASYGATICAERTACVKAVTEGYRKLQAVAVTSSEGEAPMCGICRQFLSEFGPGMIVIGGSEEEELKITSLDKLLPGQFSLDPDRK